MSDLLAAPETPKLDQYLSMSTAIGLDPEISRDLWLAAKDELEALKTQYAALRRHRFVTEGVT